MNEGRGPNDRIDFANPNQLIRNLFYGIESSQLEAKSGLSQGNLDSVAQKMLDIGEVPQSVKDFFGKKYETNLEEKALKEKETAARKAAAEGKTVGRGRKISSARRASGFIPNFAGIKNAMQTERKMGGNPAIDFQEDIGLYVRDKNTQPNFAAVKRDHPEGINNAIKNSKMAQETLAKGFIPNFAAKGGSIGGGIKDIGPSFKKLLDDSNLPPALKAVKENAFQSSLAFSALSGIVESFNQDGKDAFGTVTSEVLKGASTFQTVSQVIPGQLGLLAGAFIGLNQTLMGIDKAFKDMPMNEIIDKSKLSGESLGKLNDSTQSYIQAFQKLQDVYKSKSSYKEVAKAEKNLHNALQDLPPMVRAEIASAKNLSEIEDIVAEAVFKKGQETGKLGSAADIAEKNKNTRQTTTFDYLNRIGEQLQSGFMGQGFSNTTSSQLAGGVYTGKGAKGEKAAEQDAQNILKNLDKGFIEGIKNKTIDLTQTGKPLIETLKKFGLSLEQEEALTGMMNNEANAGAENFNLLGDKLKLAALQSIQAEKAEVKGTEARKKAAEAAEKEAEAARKKAEADQAAAAAAEAAADAARENAIFQMELANLQKSNQSRIATEAAKSQLGTMQPFTGEATMAKGSAQIEEIRRTEENAYKNKSLQTTATKEMGDNLASVIQGQIDKLRGEGKDVTGLSNRKAGLTAEIAKGGTPEEVSKRLEAYAAQSGLDQADLISLTSKQKDSIEKMNQGIILNNEELKTQNKISVDQLKAQLQQIKDQKLLKGGGGIQGFLNPETLKDPLEKFTQGLEGMKTGKRMGMGMMEARGSLQAGMSLQELTGGFGSDKLNKSLRGQVVPQMAEQKRTMFLDMAAQAQAAGNDDLAQVARDAASEAQAMAEKQFDNQFKLEDNVAGIYDLLKTELKGGNSREGQTQTGVEKGIEQASTAMAAQETASTVGTTAPTIAPNTPEGALWKQVKAANPYQNPTATGAGPASATPIGAGTLAADKAANAYKEKPISEFTRADYKAREMASDQEWNKKMDIRMSQPFGYKPELGKGPSVSDFGKSGLSTGEGIGRGKIGPIGTPLANTPTTTTGQVKDYNTENSSKQQQLLAQRNALAGKNDPESVRQRKKLDENLSTLRDQQKTAGTAGKEAGMRERPAQEIERQQKGRPLSSNQNDQGQGDKSQKLADAIEKNTKATTESKSEVNVAFTPISVEFKGSIETANDELSQKTMDAIQKAVEQIAPGIMAKLKGPPTEAKA